MAHVRPQAGFSVQRLRPGRRGISIIFAGPLVISRTSECMSVAVKKGTKMAARWRPARAAVRSEPFPLIRRRCPEWSGAVKGAPLLGAAKRTLDGEDRSEMIAEEGKAGRRVSERWAA